MLVDERRKEADRGSGGRRGADRWWEKVVLYWDQAESP